MPELRLTVPLPDGLPNRGVMPLSQLTVHRHGQRKQALITLSGEIDLESALRLHHPPTTLARILDLTGCGFPLLGFPFGHLPPPPGDTPAAPRPAPPHRSVPLAPVLLGGVR